MSVLVVIPHGRNDDLWRLRARDYVTERYRTVHRLPVILAECPTGTWSKGATANPAIMAADADVVIVADADSYVDDVALRWAINHAEAGGWAMAHTMIRRYSREATEAIYTGGRCRRTEKGDYPGVAGGGIVIAHRDAWRTVGGFDPRFTDWGGEDYALGVALKSLVGPVKQRRTSPLLHLWHPPAEHKNDVTDGTRALWDRYRRTWRTPADMADLVREW